LQRHKNFKILLFLSCRGAV